MRLLSADDTEAGSADAGHVVACCGRLDPGMAIFGRTEVEVVATLEPLERLALLAFCIVILTAQSEMKATSGSSDVSPHMLQTYPPHVHSATSVRLGRASSVLEKGPWKTPHRQYTLLSVRVLYSSDGNLP